MYCFNNYTSSKWEINTYNLFELSLISNIEFRAKFKKAHFFDLRLIWMNSMCCFEKDSLSEWEWNQLNKTLKLRNKKSRIAPTFNIYWFIKDFTWSISITSPNSSSNCSKAVIVISDLQCFFQIANLVSIDIFSFSFDFNFNW